MGPDNAHEHNEGCNDELHKAYDHLQAAIQNFVQVKEGNDQLFLTDFFVYTASADLLNNATEYHWAASPSAPHILEGLLVFAGRDLIDDEIERKY